MNQSKTETVRPMVTITIPLTEAEKHATEIDPQQIGEGLRAECNRTISEIRAEAAESSSD